MESDLEGSHNSLQLLPSVLGIMLRKLTKKKRQRILQAIPQTQHCKIKLELTLASGITRDVWFLQLRNRSRDCGNHHFFSAITEIGQ